MRQSVSFQIQNCAESICGRIVRPGSLTNCCYLAPVSLHQVPASLANYGGLTEVGKDLSMHGHTAQIAWTAAIARVG